MRTRKLVHAVLAAGLILSLLVPPALCLQVYPMVDKNLQAAERSFRSMGYNVTVHDGFIVGEPDTLAAGTGKIMVRVCDEKGCWKIFEVRCEERRVINIRTYPARPPDSERIIE